MKWQKKCEEKTKGWLRGDWFLNIVINSEGINVNYNN